MRKPRIGMTLAVLLCLTACGDKEGSVTANPNDPANNQNFHTQPGTGGASAPRSGLTLDELRAEIERLTQDKACASVGDCASVPIGYKSCGGPESYTVYSRPRTDEQLLIERAQQYYDLDRQQDEAQGTVSDCLYVVEPVLSCDDGRCGPVS